MTLVKVSLAVIQLNMAIYMVIKNIQKLTQLLKLVS